MTYVEKCLYEYKSNVAVLDYLREERKNLASIHGHNYENSSTPNSSDPVLTTVNLGMELERKIACVEKRIKPIARLLSDLTAGRSLRVQQLRDILCLKYIAHEDNQRVQEEMKVSVSTYWRRVRELLRLARKYFGNE